MKCNKQQINHWIKVYIHRILCGTTETPENVGISLGYINTDWIENEENLELFETELKKTQEKQSKKKEPKIENVQFVKDDKYWNVNIFNGTKWEEIAFIWKQRNVYCLLLSDEDPTACKNFPTLNHAKDYLINELS